MNKVILIFLAAAGVLVAQPLAAHAGLKDYAAAYTTPIGSVADGNLIEWNADNGTYNDTLASEFNLIGAENDLKMGIWTGWSGDPMTGTPIINWNAPDQVANFARSHGMHMRGHCLVYHCVVPQFLNPNGDNSSTPYTDAQIQHMVQVYITTIMQRYADVIEEWDVSNEDFDSNGNLSNQWLDSNGWHNDFWYQHLGGSLYFYNIYTWARNAVPSCKLYYNDFGTEYPGPHFSGMLNTIKIYRSYGCPIDGIGFQCHENTDSPSQVLSAANTAQVDAAGMEWMVTELDVQMPSNPGQNDINTQNAIYSQVTDVCMHDSSCKGMMLWGFTDAHSWLNPSNGDILDSNYNKKTGYWAVDYMLCNAPNAIAQNHYYGILNQESGFAAEVLGGSMANNGPVDQYPNWGGPNQKWEFIPAGSGFYSIINQNSGLAMEVQGGSLAQGAEIDQYSPWGGSNQLWAISPVVGGGYEIWNANSGLALETYYQDYNAGDYLNQWGWWTGGGGPNQKWNLQY